MTLPETIRRIATETTAGSEKEAQAVLLACFVHNVHRDCLAYFIKEERKYETGHDS